MAHTITLAKAILAKAEALEINIEPAENHKALAGIGVEGYLAGKHILVSAQITYLSIY